MKMKKDLVQYLLHFTWQLHKVVMRQLTFYTLKLRIALFFYIQINK